MNEDLLKYFKGDTLAANVFPSKYAAQGELTPVTMHKRLAKEFARMEFKHRSHIEMNGAKNLSPYGQKNWEDGGNLTKKQTEDKIFELFDGFRQIIPQGSIMATLGTDTIASLSNCWVEKSPVDSYGGILTTDANLAYYYKRRGGVGVDISELRPNGTNTNNTAKTTTGAVSFMHRFSNTTREVAMAGRRGALMMSMSINHPDIMDFIKIKRDGTSVTGANVSIRLNNDFMKAVENNKDYILRFPVDTSIKELSLNKYDEWYPDWDDGELNYIAKDDVYVKVIKAKEYWEEIVKSAKNHAEPGLMYWDNAIDYDPAAVYSKYKPVSTNPCFTGDNKLLTVDGYKSFWELEDTEFELIDSKGEIKNGKVWKSGYKDIIEVSTWNKHTFKCTPDHLFMTTQGESEAKDLKGKRLLPFYNIKDTYGDFTALGFLQGDSCLGRLSSKSHLGLEVNIGENDEEIKPLFNVEGSETKFYVNGYNILLRKLGFSSEQLPFRELPTSIDTWDIEEIKDFLTGLYSANGSVIKGHRVSFKSTCKRLIEGLQSLLKDKLDIGSYYTTNKAKKIEFYNGEYLCKESYDLNISKFEDVLKFTKDISFVHTYKKESLNELILIKAPLVKNIKPLDRDYVFDFSITEGDNHWGVVAPSNNWSNGFIVHNCGEQYLNANDSCRLLALNLFGFVDNPFTEDAKINVERLYEVSYQHTRMGDNLVDLELEYIQRIIDKIKQDPEDDKIKRGELELWEESYKNTKAGRRIGLGITGLADMLAALNMKYDSKGGMEVIKHVMKLKMEAELDCSIDLAILRGTFEGYNVAKEYSIKGDKVEGTNLFYQTILKEFPEQVARMMEFGRRNVSWSTIAPTGSVSILTQTTSGCEPLFQPFYMRRKKINPSDKSARIDFVDEIGDSWQEFPVLHQKFKEWVLVDCPYCDVNEMSKDELQKAFEKSPWYGSTANDIDWNVRNDIQAILQKYTTNAISSTINLPSTVTEQEVSDIYMNGWKKGLKGQTVYVDGSRSGVLVSNDKKEEVTTFHENHAPRRTKRLEAKLVRFNNNKERWIAFVGLMDGKPYEIFTGRLEDIKIPLKVEEGEIVKVRDEEGKKRYDFEYEEGTLEGIDGIFDNGFWNYAKLVSGMLRHGMPLHFAVDMVSNMSFPEDHINTWKNGVARTLKKFIPDGKAEGMKCNDCASTNVIFQEGCSSCLDCGSSKCG